MVQLSTCSMIFISNIKNDFQHIARVPENKLVMHDDCQTNRSLVFRLLKL